MTDALLERTAAHALPRLRGWLHAGMFPLASAAGLALVLLAHNPATRIGTAIFALTAVSLFGVSGLFHCGRWSPATKQMLDRLDHANIFLFIAGTYTPFALLLLEPADAWVSLGLVWVGAIAGAAVSIFVLEVPRWLNAPIYLALGWSAVFWFPDLWQGGGLADRGAVVLFIVGGALYTVGALAFAFRRPNPSPRWFGFHEVFHACTVAAYVAHFVAIAALVHR